jgi:hypothetical protein
LYCCVDRCLSFSLFLLAIAFPVLFLLAIAFLVLFFGHCFSCPFSIYDSDYPFWYHQILLNIHLENKCWFEKWF